MEAGGAKELGDQVQEGDILQNVVRGKATCKAWMRTVVVYQGIPKKTAGGSSWALSEGEVARYAKDLFLALAN
jgi:hypothetical protein